MTASWPPWLEGLSDRDRIRAVVDAVARCYADHQPVPDGAQHCTAGVAKMLLEQLLTPEAPEGDGFLLAGFLAGVRIANDWLDSDVSPQYRAQPLAHLWARVTKVCSEAGEVMDALSALTGENPRKGVSGTREELLGELGDTASAAILAIQHLTGDTAATWEVVSAAVAKVRQRAERAAVTP